ncbi:hypothetical protein FPRO06_11964 [Fusarium proliferatum]|nr:hypothetical protein FPRO04_14146 [Fusarium proliferatum]KAG4280631.1 hypothetical protein FPRO06_11964 [Fusarium proliferatum]
MKFTAASAIIIGVLATTTFATPTNFSKTSPRDLAAQLEGCLAADSCRGPGGGELCNDRVTGESAVDGCSRAAAATMIK